MGIRQLKFVLLGLFLVIGNFSLMAQNPVGPYEKLSTMNMKKKVDNFFLIFDRSDSMSESYGGNDKFTYGKSILTGINQTLSGLDFMAGLRTFGSRKANSSESQSLKLYGVSQYSGSDLGATINSLEAGEGGSPLALGIEGARTDLATTAGKTAVIIISDGKESDGEALTEARNLKSEFGDNVSICTVLVGNDPEGRSLLKSIAAAGNCEFETANHLAMNENMHRYLGKVLFVEDKMPAPKPMTDTGWVTASISYPTGVESSSTIKIEKTFPKRAILGESFRYILRVTNLTDLDLENVNVIEKIPESFEIVGSDPKIYAKEGGRVAWALGKMERRSTQVITVDGRPTKNHSVPCCTNVNFNLPDLCLATEIIEPALVHSISSPGENLVCDQLPLNYTVSNTGQTNLQDVFVKIDLPEGVTSASGDSSITRNVGALSAGETKTGQIMFDVQTKGNYTFNSSASGTSLRPFEDMSFTQSTATSSSMNQGISAEADPTTTKVTQPVLSLQATSKRGTQYIGRDIGYNFEISNIGNADATNTVVEASIPSITSFKSASNGGVASGGLVRWDFGTLRPNESRKFSMDLGTSTGGNAVTNAKATGNCCDTVTASAATKVIGIPAILVEVIDLEDPIELNETVVYEIRITNQGNADATNVQIVAELEDMELLQGSGTSIPEETYPGLIQFDIIPVMAPKAQAAWTLRVKALKVGDIRFKVVVNSDEMQRPVQETEATQIY